MFVESIFSLSGPSKNCLNKHTLLEFSIQLLGKVKYVKMRLSRFRMIWKWFSITHSYEQKFYIYIFFLPHTFSILLDNVMFTNLKFFKWEDGSFQYLSKHYFLYGTREVNLKIFSSTWDVWIEIIFAIFVLEPVKIVVVFWDSMCEWKSPKKCVITNL